MIIRFSKDVGVLYNYLGISLQRLLQVDKLRRARVLAGKRGMNKRITKVDVMEVPDIIDLANKINFPMSILLPWIL